MGHSERDGGTEREREGGGGMEGWEEREGQTDKQAGRQTDEQFLIQTGRMFGNNYYSYDYIEKLQQLFYFILF